MIRSLMIAAPMALLVACGGAQEGGKSSRTLIQNKGSDTLLSVAQAWAEAYRDVDANVAVAVTGGGSGTGISALINGTVDIANSSRSIKDKEREHAKKAGQDPVEHVVGYDALAVYVHHDNPLSEMTIATLQAIYGEGGELEKWSQLGVEVPGCPSDEIIRVSRQNNSGTFAYFKEAVLGKKGEYKLGSRDMHGSKDVVDLVEKTPCAIGYSGLAYATDHIKMPCVKKSDDAPCVAPAVDTAVDRTYPIARPLLLYTNGQPTGKVGEYMNWVMGDKGQCILKNAGYAPVRNLQCG